MADIPTQTAGEAARNIRWLRQDGEGLVNRYEPSRPWREGSPREILLTFAFAIAHIAENIEAEDLAPDGVDCTIFCDDLNALLCTLMTPQEAAVLDAETKARGK
jgi:hypothetical protein